MTSIVYLLAFLLTSAAAFGQGTVDFNNRALYASPPVDVPFFDDRGIRLAGTNYLAQLYAGSTADVLVPVGTPVPFVTNGYWNPTGNQLKSLVTIPETIAGIGGPVWVQARAWEAAGGPTFEQAALSGNWTGISGILFLRSTGHGGVNPTIPKPLIGYSYPGSPDLIVLQYPGNPLIVREPQKPRLRAGEKATLSVVASGGVALSYQWYQGQSGDTAKPIPAGTNANLTTPPLSADTSFWVKVDTSAGSTNSAAAMVTVLPANAARLNLRLVSGQPNLSIDGPVGTNYRIDYSADISMSDWTTLTNVTLKTNPTIFTDTTATDSARFYRVVAP